MASAMANVIAMAAVVDKATSVNGHGCACGHGRGHGRGHSNGRGRGKALAVAANVEGFPNSSPGGNCRPCWIGRFETASCIRIVQSLTIHSRSRSQARECFFIEVAVTPITGSLPSHPPVIVIGRAFLIFVSIVGREFKFQCCRSRSINGQPKRPQFYNSRFAFAILPRIQSTLHRCKRTLNNGGRKAY